MIPCLKTVSGRRWPSQIISTQSLSRGTLGLSKVQVRSQELIPRAYATRGTETQYFAAGGVPNKHIASVHRCQGFWFAGVFSHRNARAASESCAPRGQHGSPSGSSQPGSRGSRNTCRANEGADGCWHWRPAPSLARCPRLTAPRGLPRAGAAPGESLCVAFNNSQPGSSRNPDTPRGPAPSRPHPGSCPGGT